MRAFSLSLYFILIRTYSKIERTKKFLSINALFAHMDDASDAIRCLLSLYVEKKLLSKFYDEMCVLVTQCVVMFMRISNSSP